MAKRTYSLSNVVKNDFIYWNVCSQAANLGEIVICDDQFRYATIRKTSSSTELQQLGTGYAVYNGGNNLRIELDVPQSREIDANSFSSNITDKNGRIVGVAVTLCFEDGTDKDYNDFYVNFVAWRKKG